MTDAPHDSLRIARQFIQSRPPGQALGMGLDGIGYGWAGLSMPYYSRLVGDPLTGVIHGGAVSALMDTACVTAVMCHPQAGFSTATLDLRIDYMRPATPGQTIRTRPECHHVPRSVAFVRAVATDDDEARPVAMATGAFTGERKE